MTLTRTDPEPGEHSLVTRRGRRWFRDDGMWHEQLDDGTAEPVTWAQLVDDEPVELAIEGSTGLPPVAGTGRHERRRVHGRGGHP